MLLVEVLLLELAVEVDEAGADDEQLAQVEDHILLLLVEGEHKDGENKVLSINLDEQLRDHPGKEEGVGDARV